MKKILGIIIAVIIAFALGALTVTIFMNRETPGETRVANVEAQKDIDNRYLTIVNETKQTINEVHVFVGEGTEIEDAFQKNPDEKSFSIEIPSEYENCEDFRVKLVDNYERVYEKVVDKVKKNGRTEVVINEDDYLEEKGDWIKNIYEFFNS